MGLRRQAAAGTRHPLANTPRPHSAVGLHRCTLETLTNGEKQNSKEERLDLVVLVGIFTWTPAHCSHHRHTDTQAAFRSAFGAAHAMLSERKMQKGLEV